MTPYRFDSTQYYEQVWRSIYDSLTTDQMDTMLYWLYRRVKELANGGDPAYTIKHGWDPGTTKKEIR